MTNPTVPSQRPRKVLEQIAPVAWEHPADRAALQTLRSIPGFDELVRKIVGFFGERGIRLMFQANAVRVGPTQMPRLHALLTEVKVTMDWPDDLELYVTQTPFVNAGAVGVERPFIVLNSAAVSMLTDDELRVLIGHELGHVMSGHSLYRTVLILILNFGLGNLPLLAGIVLLPIRLALLEWYRKSELSSDRAGLLASQDPTASLKLFLKLAGGSDPTLNLDAFLTQAREYRDLGGAVDTVYKILNTLDMTHPFHTLRAAELQGWIESGGYDRIFRGEYARRGSEQDRRPLADDMREAAEHYGKEAREVVGHVADAARKAAQAFTDAFKDVGRK
jgi:Zn-dependent protease with chaperone function